MTLALSTIARYVKTTPTIYGVSHSESETEAILELMPHLKAQGFRSVGLEISPFSLSHAPYISGQSIKFANRAASLQMSVIPLEKDDIGQTRRAYDYMVQFLQDDGTIDTAAIDAQIRFYENDPAARATRLVHEATQMFVGQLMTFKKAMRETKGDLEQLAARWVEWNVTRTDAQLRRAIRSEKPDIVFIGSAHAKKLTDLSRYQMVDISEIHHDGTVLPETSPFPHLHALLKEFAEKKEIDTALQIHSFLFQTAADLLKKDFLDPYLSAVLDRASVVEPRLPYLAARIRMREAQCLVPETDMEFIKIPVETARRRIEAAILTSV
jgi:hypothetical protein